MNPIFVLKPLRMAVVSLFIPAVCLLAWSQERVPTSVVFHKDTLYRRGAAGDNWCITLTAGGSQITSMCDGNWLGKKYSTTRTCIASWEDRTGSKSAIFPVIPCSREKREAGLPTGSSP